MFLYAYVFSMVLGGVLLTASMIGGGDDDATGDAPALEGDTGGDGPDLGQQALATHHQTAHGDATGLLASFLSLRFWTFFLGFGGLTGVAFEALALAPALATLAIASVTGIVIGQVTVAVFRALGSNESGSAAETRDFVGKQARVLVGFGPGETGKVRLELKGTSVDVLATSDDPSEFTHGQTVTILALHDTVARVARTEPPSLLAPPLALDASLRP